MAVMPSWYRFMAPVLHVEYAARRAMRRQDRRAKHRRRLMSRQSTGAAVAISRVDDFDSAIDSEDDDYEEGEHDGEDEEDGGDEEEKEGEEDEEDEDNEEADEEEGANAELPAPLAVDPCETFK